MTIRDRSWCLVVIGVMSCGPSPEPIVGDATPPALFAASGIVISQLYGGGGNSGAPFANDYVELFNRGASPTSVDGWSVQYASSNGTSWSKANLAGTIPAGGYYLVGLAGGGTGGASLPATDATGAINMSGTSGTIALVDNQTLLACGGSTACLPDADIRDFVGYGSATQHEGSGDAPALSTATAGVRAAHGCTDTDNNASDFSTEAPAPRNSSTPDAPCTTASDAGVIDAPPPPSDAATDASVDAAPDASSGGNDGPPTREPCTSSFGSGMSTAFGRLDGFLVAIVNPGTSGCASDSNHVHLQVLMKGSVYNIAVDVDSTGGGSSEVSFLNVTAPLDGGAWSEGWHTGEKLDYVSTLGVHSTDMVAETKSQMISLLGSDLATVNHVSIFTTGFNSSGGHLVHREGSSHDGAIVIEPLSASPQYLLFRFPEQSF
jgi:hypothetical protein